MSRIGIGRPLTDNDNASFGPEMLGERLRAAGLDLPARMVDEWVVAVGDPTGGPVDDGIVSARARFKVGERLSIRVTWLISSSGEVAVDFTARGDLDLPPLLRLGLELELPSSFADLEWFGPGPGETYRDRLGGFPISRHAMPVSDTFFPYARPQETGNHTDLRWLALRSTGPALVVTGSEHFDGAAHHSRPEDIAAAHHPHEIVARDVTVLRLDVAHSGIGTGSCGPGINQTDQVRPLDIRHRLVLRAAAPEDDLGQVARRATDLPRPRRWNY